MSDARMLNLLGYTELSNGKKEAAAAKAEQKVHAEQQKRILEQMQNSLLNAASTLTNLTLAMSMIPVTTPLAHIEESSLVFHGTAENLKTAFDEMTNEKNKELFQGYKNFHSCLTKIRKLQADIDAYLKKGEPKLNNAKLRSDHAELTSKYNEFKTKNSALIDTYNRYDSMVKTVLEHVEEQQQLQIFRPK